MLEKILEELMNRYRKVKTDEDLEWNRAVDMCIGIIRKHMNDIKGKEYISRQDAIDVIMQTYRYESDRMTALQELPTFHMNDGWIPVSNDLAPEDGEGDKLT